jgi:hypothetical protein
MIRHAAYALLFLFAFMFAVAALQDLDDQSETEIWSPK